MKPWILFATVATTAFGLSAVWQHYRLEAARDEVMRPHHELRARHERESAEFKAREEVRLLELAAKNHAIIENWKQSKQAASIDAYFKQRARIEELYGVYQRVLDDLATLNAENLAGKVTPVEWELRVAVAKDQWAEVDHWIREYNRDADEQRKIDILPFPAARKVD